MLLAQISAEKQTVRQLKLQWMPAEKLNSQAEELGR